MTIHATPKAPFRMRSRNRLLAVLLLSVACPGAVVAQDVTAQPAVDAAKEAARDDVAQPASPDLINFAAGLVEYDSNADMVTATGNVIVNRDGYSLRADKVVWNRTSGEVVADGNIRSVSPNGDVAYGEKITLTDSLKDGVVDNLLVVLADGSRLAAQKGERKDGALFLDYAAYTPCRVENDEGCPKNPSWQVKAVKVRYDPDKKRVYYEGARLELFGLPLIPIPYLSHPAGVKAGDGFLVPSLRLSRNNGLEVEQPYYWRLAPNRDLTASVTAFTEVAPMLKANFRTLETKGALEATVYGTYSQRVAPVTGISDTVFRGYFEGSGKFQLDPNWSISSSLRIASDRTFLRRYDISRDDRLRSTFTAERIDDRSYFNLSGWAVQTLRVGDVQGLTPIALPEIDYRLRLDDPILGGKVQLQANSVAVGRTTGQDTQRAFISGQWDLRRITGMGQEVNFTVLARGDVYHSDENSSTLAALYRGESGWKGRGIVAGAMDIRWPFIGEVFGGTQVLTPRVQLVAAHSTANLEIPNEDARAIDLEDSNLFALNRFPGYDRYEDNYRITYGFDWNFRSGDINIDANIGQSFRLSDRLSILPDGTGLSEKLSDIVGRTEVRYKDLVKLTHRFRLDKDDFAIRRNEIDATFGSKTTYATIGYLRLDRNIAAGLEDLRDREEVRLSGRASLAKYWSIFGSTIIDLTDTAEDPLATTDGFDPIRHSLGISYDDECLSIGVTWRRDYQPSGDAQRGNSFLLRLAFRNLGV